MRHYRLHAIDEALGKDFSGLLVFCEDDAAARYFAKAFFRCKCQVEIWAGTRFVDRVDTPRKLDFSV